MADNKVQRNREVEQITKPGLSSDCRLQLACMKLELLVIADQHAAVNTFPGLVSKPYSNKPFHFLTLLSDAFLIIHYFYLSFV